MIFRQQSIPPYGIALAFLGITSCSDASAHIPSNATPKPHRGAPSAMTILDEPAKGIDTTPPTPEIDLPELPFDREKLPGVLKLDVMRKEAAYIDAATMSVEASFEALKQSSSASINGTNAEQIKALLGILDGFSTFDLHTVAMAEKARERFSKTYVDDEAFRLLYIETFRDAEDELDSIITDGPVRRATKAVLDYSYKQAPRTTLARLAELFEEEKGLRAKAIGQVVRSAETSLMVADYKKGQQLVDLLQGTRARLRLVAELDQDNQDIEKALALVDEKQASRTEEIVKSREAFRMPNRYGKSNAPANAAALEESLAKSLKEDGYAVHDVRIASAWVAVRSPLGVHLYDQVDFHVAVASHIEDEAKDGVLDVLYVTAKTNTAHELPFARTSAGCIGQMLKENL